MATQTHLPRAVPSLPTVERTPLLTGRVIALLLGAAAVLGAGGVLVFRGGLSPNATKPNPADPTLASGATPGLLHTSEPGAQSTPGQPSNPQPGSPDANPAGEKPIGPNQLTNSPPGPQPQTGQPLPNTANAPAPLPPGPGQSADPNAHSGIASDIMAKRDAAERALRDGRLVEARSKFNDLLLEPRLGANDRQALREQLKSINETLVFSPTVAPGDTIADTYAVQSGDSFVRIASRQGLPIDWRLIQRVNRIANPNSLRIGQKLKVFRQPFHAIVHKRDYRMDIYAGETLPPGGLSGLSTGPDGQLPSWTFITSFPVGLGESNGTPEGAFVVRPQSKLVNPRWVNPRTGEVFEADNPKNPIGERWIGLLGIDDSTSKFQGYGIHGTTEPDSIGQQRSMGCVRMNAADVELVYELLVDRLSSVQIRP